MMSLTARPHSTMEIYRAAIVALRAGISVIPIRADGTKSSAVSWKVYQAEKPTLADVRRWFHGTNEQGIAFVTGRVSGGLELLDFDTVKIYELWAERMREEGLEILLRRIEWGYKEQSPDGVHLLYRCPDISGNQKLARKPVPGPAKVQCLIETRGEGGYCIVAPSSGLVHPSGKPYRLISGGPATILTITLQERQQLFGIARTFNEVLSSEISPPASKRHTLEYSDRRPGDIFNERVSWEDLLPQYGWELVRYVGEEGQWRRPGKEGEGISATTNYGGSDLLYVFSTSTCFEPERGYNKFSAYALLAHEGDFSAAARALVEQGYVDEEKSNEASHR